MLFINEIFASIQGEGVNAGKPCIFVRFQGCECQCDFCDTKQTWKLGYANENPIEFALTKSANTPRWATCTEDELINFLVKKFPNIKNVVLTGGEPALFDLQELTEELIEEGFRVQIETSGTEPIKADPRVWVTVSPKFKCKNGKSLIPSALNRADELKQVVTTEQELKFLEGIKPLLKASCVICLQPESQRIDSTSLCVSECLKKGYRLSLQTHKFIELR